MSGQDGRRDGLLVAAGVVDLLFGVLLLIGFLARGSGGWGEALRSGWVFLAWTAFVVLGGVDALRGSRAGAAAAGMAALGGSAFTGLLLGSFQLLGDLGDLNGPSALSVLSWSLAAVLGVAGCLLGLMAAVAPSDERQAPVVVTVVLVLAMVAVVAGAVEAGGGAPRISALITPVPVLTAANLTMVALLVASVLIAAARPTASALGLVAGSAFFWVSLALTGALDVVRSGAVDGSGRGDLILVGVGSGTLLVLSVLSSRALWTATPLAAGGASSGVPLGAGLAGAAGTTGAAGAAGASAAVGSWACLSSVVYVFVLCGVGVVATVQPSGTDLAGGTWLSADGAWRPAEVASSGDSIVAAVGTGSRSRSGRSTGQGAGTGSFGTGPGPGATVTVPCTSSCTATGGNQTAPTQPPPTQPTPTSYLPPATFVPDPELTPPTGPVQVQATAQSHCPARNCKIFVRVTPHDDLTRPSPRYYYDGDRIDIYCQSEGQFVHDGDTGRESTVWYQTQSGAYMSGIYLQLDAPVRGC